MALTFFVLGAGRAAAQPAASEVHQPHDPPSSAAGGDDAAQQHDMQHMQMEHGDHMWMPPTRDGSGTSWLPDDTPMYALHAQAGPWTLMAHGSVFFHYLYESGDRGSDQAGSVNWFMGMAGRSVGAGHLRLRAMMSLEPWTVRGCGYPDLLASGEVCEGEAIHDRQHPHDLFMELAATYDRPLAGDVRLELYGGPVGEPALGPTAFSHRISAMPSPIAPITHHWFDSTHIAYGVVTGGLYGKVWKTEASVFNGREPDENRTNFDFGALDSWSGRVWFLPTSRWALQVSAGRLTEAEESHEGGPRIDVTRGTASATYHRLLREGSIWASTVGWSRNQEQGSDATHAWLAETNVTFDERDTWFGRVEVSGKTGHDLGIESTDVFTVAKFEGGYTRFFRASAGLKPGVGAIVSASVVPESLTSLYGNRVNFGFGVFVTLRPAQLKM
ncbi:MAG TPA: hypothetical protein VKE96_28915 [Vicinamibacterales bacterium]|nr:hypothetical protein [Vicinamibacterales bacterium]